MKVLTRKAEIDGLGRAGSLVDESDSRMRYLIAHGYVEEVLAPFPAPAIRKAIVETFDSSLPDAPTHGAILKGKKT